MEEDGHLLAGGTFFAAIIALGVMLVGGIILYLSWQDWQRKKKVQDLEQTSPAEEKQ